ncbi:MAG: MG2 domain-containing protein [Bacteroidales bacterium]|nr:MG2 domain-containing protein [Bacteroidales bacterium]
MKKLLFTTLFLVLFVFVSGFLVKPTTGDYDKNWKEVEKNVREGLPKSALIIVDEVYRKAKSEGNRPQQIKALIYRVSLQSQFKEEHLVNAIQQFEQELPNADTPEKQILQSLLAELYQGFYQQNRWVINDRSSLEGYDDNDIRTWDAVKLNRKIKSYYLQSLADEPVLKTIPLNSFTAILQQTDSSGFNLWPSLYDLLANRALGYFSGEDVGLTDLAGSSSSPSKMLPLDQFLKEKTNKTDRSNYAVALNLYRHLLGFHLEKGQTAALVDLELKRLAFVYNHAMEQAAQTAHYIDILEAFREQNKNHPSFVKITVELAQLRLDQSRKYAPLVGDDYRWEKNEAAQICEEAVEAYPDESSTDACRALLEEIRQKKHRFQTTAVALPGQPFLALLNFKNTSRLYFRIVKIDPEKDRKRREKESEKTVMSAYLQQEAVANWHLDLPDTRDHQQHSTEMRMPALEKGFYVIFASDDSSFSKISNLNYQPLWVSRLSYIIKPNELNGTNDLFVLDRESGNKVGGVKITVLQKVYESRFREYRTKTVGKLVTDENGFVNFESFGGKNYGSYLLALEKDGDQLYADNYLNFYRRAENTKARLHTYFFTDRAIYRPGQTVYFKGILVEITGRKTKIKTGAAVDVQFLNASRKKVSSGSFVSNEFGSFHGSFVIPTGGLNGQMSIKTKSGSVSFQVEEYKRPTFKVLFDTLEGQYKLDERITVKGRAEDFAGSMLSSASVKYRVTRQAGFPQPWFYYREFDLPWPVFQTETEIAHGTVQTLSDGTFEVPFEAVPDLRVPARLSPIFHYRIYADVTDITGEVQSAETSIQIGAASINLAISAAETIDSENPLPISLRANNLSGAPIDVLAKVMVFKLSPPERLLNKRLWKQADLHIIPETEFKKDFPHAVYTNEDNKINWKKTAVASRTVPVKGKTRLFGYEIRHWKPGEYLMEALAVDQRGDTVKALQFFTLYSGRGKKMPGKKIYWSTLSTELAEPGETLKLVVGSAAKKTKLLFEITNGKQMVERRWITLNKGQKVIEIPVKENFRGNFSIKLGMVRFNRFYSDGFTVEVPFSNKKLTVTLQTRRDFLTPGKKEEWQVKISGPQGDAAAAELLAGMYDASLDQFRSNAWKLNLHHPKAQAQSWKGGQFQAVSNRSLYSVLPGQFKAEYQQYPAINWFGYYFFYRGGRQMNIDMSGMAASKSESVEVVGESDNQEIAEETIPADKGITPPSPHPEKKETPPPLRTNFNETAFFYPELRTDSSGNILFSFITPDALTEWKLMMLATSKDLKTGTLVRKIKARKELMVLPNVPRFVRQGDRLVFTAKVVNFTDKEMEVNTRIEFLDAVSMKTVSIFAEGQQKSTKLRIPARQNAQVSWEIEIPDNLSMLAYRIKASSETFSDGEERMFPVLTNRMLVTESLPMPINGKETRTFRFDKLLNSDKIAAISTRKDFRFTVEFTSNPAWYAVQALPFLSGENRESTAALFNRYFANSLSAFVANSNPKIQRVFESWKQLTPDAFLSKLQQNEELKNTVLNATPWVLEAEDETEQKRRIGILFDLNRLAGEQQTTMERLLETQLSSGAWPWFKGMQDDRYTTQKIVLGFAKLNDKGVIDFTADNQQQQMLRRAVRYLDEKVREDYEKLKKNKPDGMDKNHLGSTAIQYLYARSLLIETFPVPAKTQEAFDYYTGQAKKYWLKQDKLLQGMIALAMNRLSYRNQAEAIVRSLKERSLQNEEAGMYWRQQNGWNWFQAPVETQALMIEVFAEIGKHPKDVEQMKIWLLKQKQTQKWKTSSATAEAVFALLMYGDNLLDNNELVKVRVGSKTIETENPDLGVEAGTGYFKTSWQGAAIEPGMGKIEVSNPNNSIAWGAAYWQYFEDLDRITAHDSPLSLEKKLFVEELTDAGPVIKPLQDGQHLKTGDKVIVRLIIRTDRNMEFVHLKDMRATAFEPLKTISGYSYKGGLGFYKNITDVSTDFFMRYLHKGTYVLEYPLHVTQSGTFSNGIATIQSMYAPEFGAHSSGIKIEVNE